MLQVEILSYNNSNRRAQEGFTLFLVQCLGFAPLGESSQTEMEQKGLARPSRAGTQESDDGVPPITGFATEASGKNYRTPNIVLPSERLL